MAEEQPQKDWQAEYQKLQAQYTDDMNKVYTVLTQNQQQQPQAPAPPEWDTQDPAKLKEQVEGSLRKTVTDTLAPVVSTLAGHQFEANMGIMRGDARFPYFGKWEPEIRQFAAQVPPGALANLQTLAQLYELVASRHRQELVEEEVQKRLQAQHQPPDTGEVEVEDEEEKEEDVETPAPVPVTPVAPPQAARATVPTQQSRSFRQPQRIRLTREQAYVADKLAMTPKEYAQAMLIDEISLT